MPIITCVECCRPRLIFSAKRVSQKEYDLLAAYKETVDYACGAPLVGNEDDLPEEFKPLAATFHVKQARCCRDEVETDYFNYANVAGCADLEWVCARCGAMPDVSPLDPTTCGKGDVTGYSGFEISQGRIMLPLCMGCRSKKLSPVLVGTTNQVEKERALREAQAKAKAAKETSAARAAAAKAAKAAAAAAAAAAAEAMEEEEGAEEMEADGGAPSQVEVAAHGQKRPQSKTSGAAKRARAKAAAAGSAAPPSLLELIRLALPSFGNGRTFYRSMLRVKVQQIDPAKSLKRKFGDKDEWRNLLHQLQEEGTLVYNESCDEIAVPIQN